MIDAAATAPYVRQVMVLPFVVMGRRARLAVEPVADQLRVLDLPAGELPVGVLVKADQELEPAGGPAQAAVAGDADQGVEAVVAEEAILPIRAVLPIGPVLAVGAVDDRDVIDLRGVEHVVAVVVDTDTTTSLHMKTGGCASSGSGVPARPRPPRGGGRAAKR